MMTNKAVWRRVLCVIMAAVLCTGILAGCGPQKEIVVIYTSAEDYRVEHMRQRLTEQFPQYTIILEYLPTGNHAARLMAEGTSTDCDITYDLEYAYLDKLANAGVLADLSDYDLSIFRDDVNKSNYYMAEYRNGGAIVINPAVLEKYNLPKPTCYDDLLKSEYRGLISMPNPTSSGTGYMFLLAMVNERDAQKGFEYFDALAENVLQFTSSGSGPINALIQGEVAIGLSITGTAVTAINDGAQLEILFFEEGSPYALYGQGIIEGKQNRPAVKEVYDFLYSTYGYENCEKFFPEPIYKDRTFTIENYPTNITYCDMGDVSAVHKEHLLSMWKY